MKMTFDTVLDHARIVEIVERLEGLVADADLESTELERDVCCLLVEVSRAADGHCCEPCGNCGACYPICDAHSAWCSGKRVKTSDRVETEEETD